MKRSTGKGKGRASGAGRKAATPAPEVFVAPVIQEDVWVQCDACEKWRRLPPGSVVDDSAPWYCRYNTDRARNDCAIPEEDYDTRTEIITGLGAGVKPEEVGLKAAPAEELKLLGNAELSLKAQQELIQKAIANRGASTVDPAAAKKGKQQTPEPFFPGYGGASSGILGTQKLKVAGSQQVPSGRVFTSLKEELQQLVAACKQIVSNGGAWQATPDPSMNPVPWPQLSPPAWVWSGLSHFAPDAARIAARAVELFSAAEYGAAAQAGGSTAAGASAAQPVELTARLALITAVALTLPAAEAAAANPSAVDALAGKSGAPAAGQSLQASASAQAALPASTPMHAVTAGIFPTPATATPALTMTPPTAPQGHMQLPPLATQQHQHQHQQAPATAAAATAPPPTAPAAWAGGSSSSFPAGMLLNSQPAAAAMLPAAATAVSAATPASTAGAGSHAQSNHLHAAPTSAAMAQAPFVPGHPPGQQQPHQQGAGMMQQQQQVKPQSHAQPMVLKADLPPLPAAATPKATLGGLGSGSSLQDVAGFPGQDLGLLFAGSTPPFGMSTPGLFDMSQLWGPGNGPDPSLAQVLQQFGDPGDGQL